MLSKIARTNRAMAVQRSTAPGVGSIDTSQGCIKARFTGPGYRTIPRFQVPTLYSVSDVSVSNGNVLSPRLMIGAFHISP
jgi:hypothetical protein